MFSSVKIDRNNESFKGEKKNISYSSSAISYTREI